MCCPKVWNGERESYRCLQPYWKACLSTVPQLINTSHSANSYSWGVFFSDKSGAQEGWLLLKPWHWKLECSSKQNWEFHPFLCIGIGHEYRNNQKITISKKTSQKSDIRVSFTSNFSVGDFSQTLHLKAAYKAQSYCYTVKTLKNLESERSEKLLRALGETLKVTQRTK